MRIEPPPSLAVAAGASPAATAAADPLDEPPEVRVGSHGLRAGPNGNSASSGIVVLPSSTHPADRSRETSSESKAAGSSGEPVP